MKTIALILFLLISTVNADRVKEMTLACYKYEDISNTKKIEDRMRNGIIPKNCMFLSSEAKVAIIDSKLKDSRFVKILLLDLETYMYTLKKDVIITNENKI